MGAGASAWVRSGLSAATADDLQATVAGLDDRLLEKLRTAFDGVEDAPARPGPAAPTAAQLQAAQAAADLAASTEAWTGDRGRRGEHYETNGGAAMEVMLEYVDLIDVQYLIALAKAGGTVPRWQEVPAAAKINSSNVWRLRQYSGNWSLPVIVLSYCWYSREHPDPLGRQLESILPILEVALAEVKRDSGEGRGPATVGVLQDFCSLPQGPDKTEAEKERFKQALGSINGWYAHPFTNVLMLTAEPPEVPEHTNRTRYEQRGWCYVEKRMSCIVKNSTCLWDLSKYQGGASWKVMTREMKAQRPAPMSPEVVDAHISRMVVAEELRFTASADMVVVIELYRRSFVDMLSSYRTMCPPMSGTIIYQNLRWTDEDAPVLAEALAYAEKHCTLAEGAFDDGASRRCGALRFEMMGNDFTQKGRRLLNAAASDKLLLEFNIANMVYNEGF